MRRLKDGSFQPALASCPHPQRRRQDASLGYSRGPRRVAQEVFGNSSVTLRADLSNDSYGFRPARLSYGRRAGHQAPSARVHACARRRHQGVLRQTYPHAIIMAGVADEVADGNVSPLWSNEFLKAGVMEEGQFRPTSVSTPQGGVISPLLANIALNSLDWQLHDAGYRFVRYADDFVVLCQNQDPRSRKAHDLRYSIHLFAQSRPLPERPRRRNKRGSAKASPSLALPSPRGA